jgi:hypothetical protein
MKMLLMRTFVGGVLFGLFASNVFAADVYFGAWKINIAKSTFSPGPPPTDRSWVQKFEPVENGIKITDDSVNAQGQRTVVEITARFDGTDYPITATVDGRSCLSTGGKALGA